MKKVMLLMLVLWASSFLFNVMAQSVPLGLNYQAQARDVDGKALANSGISLRVSFTSADNTPEVFYQEEHQLTTDDLGLFSLVIGKGKTSSESLMDVPWGEEPIWMEVEIATPAQQSYRLISSSQMQSVPYAIHAQQTKSLTESAEAELRDQSIFWVTSGNKDTRPDIHFLGSRDNRDFVIKTNDTERINFTKEGQMQYTSGVDGADNDPGAYPMTIEGSLQGIYIEVTGSRSNDNNFVTFADDSQIWGRVEGQTTAELTSSSTFIRETALFVAGIVATGGKIGTAIAKAAGLAASIFGAGAAAVEAATAIELGIELTAKIVNYASWLTLQLTSVGVVYSSGNGDYAEYLKRAAFERDLEAGEVVGVKGGIISLDTKDAEQILVISTAPIGLGNVPEEAELDQFEKVAFLGQVPVRVVGAAQVGDFIIPSGNNDGFAIAVNPDYIKTADYSKVIGIAWEEAPDRPFNYVNTAIGLNTNDISERAALLELKIENLQDYLNGKAPLMKEDAIYLEQMDKMDAPALPQYVKSLSDEEFKAAIQGQESMIKAAFAQTELELKKLGLDLSHPSLQEVFEDPINYLVSLRNTPGYETQWGKLDQQLKPLIGNE